LLAGLALTILTNVSPPAVAADGCAGDCNGDGKVVINELVLAVNIALELNTVTACPPADVDGNQRVVINELIIAVNNALSGCPATP